MNNKLLIFIIIVLTDVIFIINSLSENYVIESLKYIIVITIGFIMGYIVALRKRIDYG